MMRIMGLRSRDTVDVAERYLTRTPIDGRPGQTRLAIEVLRARQEEQS